MPLRFRDGMKNPAGKSVTAPQQVTKRLGDNLLSNDLSSEDAQLAPVASGDSLANNEPGRAMEFLTLVNGDSTNQEGSVLLGTGTFAVAAKELEASSRGRPNYFGSDYWLATDQAVAAALSRQG